MKNVGYLVIALLMLGCGGEAEEKRIPINTNEVDTYVTEKLGEDQVYDVSQSLRFSRDNETYEVIRYMQNDTVILYMEIEVTQDEQITRQTFYKQGVPVYVDEFIASNVNKDPFTQRKIYLDGASVLSAGQRSSSSETDLEFMEYGEFETTIDKFNFTRPDSAMNQTGDFEMKFEEFIIIDPQTYLILENDKSNYDVALFVTETTPFLDELMANPQAYVGRPVFATHQFVLMNSIERMLFIDAYFTDEQENATAETN